VDRDRPPPVARAVRLAARVLCVALAACQPVSRDGGTNLGLVDYWPNEQMLFVAARDAGHVGNVSCESSA